MTHIAESSYAPAVAEAFEEFCLDVQTEVYQPDPRWYVDVVAELPFATCYVEVENDGAADTIRKGMAQAMGYAQAGEDPRAVPVIVVPAGHTEEPDWTLLRRGWNGVAVEFDEEAGEFR